MYRFILSAVVLLSVAALAQRAEAGATTFGYTAGTGTTFAAPTNGSGQLGSPFGTVCDGVAIANCMTVLGASTAAADANLSGVVQINPKQPQLDTPLNVQPGAGTAWNSASVGATGSAVPSSATYVGLKNSSGNLIGWPTDASGLPEISPINLSSSFGSAFPSTGSAIGVSNGTNMEPITLGQTTGSASIPVAPASDYVTKLNATPSVANGNGVVPAAGLAGGATPYALISAGSTNQTVVKASAGTLWHISVQNNAAAQEYIRFINTATTPTCTASPAYEETVPPGASSTGGGIVEDFAVGMQFTTGIAFCATTAISGTGSVSANDLTINLTYK